MFPHTALLLILLTTAVQAGFPSAIFNKSDTMECIYNTCIKKCCAEGQFLADKNQCENTKENFTGALGMIAPVNYFLINKPCGDGNETLLLDPGGISEDAFRIRDDGFLVLEESGDVFGEYCVDFIEATDVVKALLCFDAGGDKVIEHNTIGN